MISITGFIILDVGCLVVFSDSLFVKHQQRKHSRSTEEAFAIDRGGIHHRQRKHREDRVVDNTRKNEPAFTKMIEFGINCFSL